ncbi:MAG: amino acid ABC transporter permease [Rubrimonas sp.]|uniref:amino acid ABC transporter permease n=1 Tax=Rubrimonas sp. TaxID=2036015 RepID=UPI002FDEFC32
MYPDPDAPRRFGWLDAALIALTALCAAYVWTRVSDVLAYRWDWSFLPQALFRRDAETGWLSPNLLLEGLLVTIRLSLWAMLGASVLGMALGAMAASARLLPRMVAAAYVGLVRNMPPLVFIFIFYFFLSSQIAPALGLSEAARGMSPAAAALTRALIGPPELLENLVSGALCLALFEAAYVCEIARAGLSSVPAEQREAARSLGLGPWREFRHVVAPQALRAVTPPLANQFIMLVKNSAIVSLISVQELTFVGTEIAVSTGRRFETWIVVAAMYFVLCYALSRLFARMERRMRARDAR